MEITTNNVPRDVIEGYELSETERKDFDYIDWNDEDRSPSFFRFKGELYDLGEIEIAPAVLKKYGWDGYKPWTYFSGVCVKWLPETDYEQVIVGRYSI